MPDGFPLIILPAVRTEFTEVSETAEEAGSEAKCEGWHQKTMYSLLSELSFGPLLQTIKSAEMFILSISTVPKLMSFLMPDKKKNMGMFQTFMLMMNQ